MTTTTTSFPFTLTDLSAFVIKRKDGTTIRTTITRGAAPVAAGTASPALPAHYTSAYTPHRSLSIWCHHYPAQEPLLATPDLSLWIADAAGARRDSAKFDLTLDCGDVLTVFQQDQVLSGDSGLARILTPHVTIKPSRVLKVRWPDRATPALDVAFWPALLETLKAANITRVLTCCQGGHGRSGTSAVALMLLLTDYSPLDAITHLRAVHCPRAIESVSQLEYLNKLAVMLGRPADALESEKVPDFRKRFLNLTSSFAAPWQDRLRSASKLADDTTRDEEAQ